MTSETRTLIETGDISGIEVECEKCKVKSIFPVSSGFKIAVYCPHCNQKWFDETSDPHTGQNICLVTDSLRAVGSHLWALSTKRTDIHAKIRLHLNSAPPIKS